jgi:hypothetical protein
MGTAMTVGEIMQCKLLLMKNSMELTICILRDIWGSGVTGARRKINDKQ